MDEVPLERPAAHDAADDLLNGLRRIVGAGHVLTAPEDTVFFSTDIFVQGVTAEAVVAPDSVEALSRVVALCTGRGRAMIPRGGGFSYTQGYVPVRSRTVIVDLRRLDRIVEINAEDLYVTVECGCTWAKLYDALKERGFRTPFFGPLSGYRSTVGGALSQGGFFLGSTQYGTTADTLLALEMVLADGSILATGSAAGVHSSSPVFRNFGPDLTGLFLHDSGALGFKARASLKLIPFPKHSRYATLAFDDQRAAVSALSDVARAGLAAECYIWDRHVGRRMGDSSTLKDKLKYVGGMAKSRSGVTGALRMVVAGRSAFSGKSDMLHVTIDDVSEDGAEGRLKLVQAIGAKRGGRSLVPAAPMAMRGRPFNDFAPLAQQRSHMRSLPTHGIFPHSKIHAAVEAFDGFVGENRAAMQAHGVTYGSIIFAIGANAVCLEPLWYWEDERLARHNRVTDKSDIKALSDLGQPSAAAEAVMNLRQGIVEIFRELGASHCQIGKAYPYRQTRKPETDRLLQQIKSAVDPLGLVNPGALGLSPPTT